MEKKKEEEEEERSGLQTPILRYQTQSGRSEIGIAPSLLRKRPTGPSLSYSISF